MSKKLLFLISILILVLPFTLFVNQALASEGSLHVTGTAVVTGLPDIVYISLGVETKHSSAEAAAKKNALIMNQVYTALKDLGLTEQQITTSGYQIYSSTQVLNRGTDQEKTITTYHVNNRVNISTKNLEQIGQIIDNAIKAGANQVQNVRFDIENKQQMQLQALKNAVQQGKAKAEAMAEAAGITLGGLANMSESYSSYTPMMDTIAVKAEALAFSNTTINPGQVEVSATVSMNYWF
ncbi:MAG: SIMPL domain-containing protein [Firmicutes bacterium]|nr:SIMPL domain-containing protein [Bacillota bacterium]